MPLSSVQPPSCKLGPGPFPQHRPGGSGRVCARCFTFEGSGSLSVTRGWKPQPSTEAGLRAPSPCRSNARVLGPGHPLLGVLGHACVTQFPCALADRVWNGARASIQPGGVVTPGRRATSHGAAVREGHGEGRSGGRRPEGSRGWQDRGLRPKPCPRACLSGCFPPATGTKPTLLLPPAPLVAPASVCRRTGGLCSPYAVLGLCQWTGTDKWPPGLTHSQRSAGTFPQGHGGAWTWLFCHRTAP